MASDPRDSAADLRYGSGTPVAIHRAFVEADVRVLTGLVEPHFMTGYSGGRKVLAPGIAGHRTIRTLHHVGGMPLALDDRARCLVQHLQNLEPPRSLATLPLCEQALDATSEGTLIVYSTYRRTTTSRRHQHPWCLGCSSWTRKGSGLGRSRWSTRLERTDKRGKAMTGLFDTAD